ncbi:MAG: 3-hydroxyacyl-ACP dehydratase [Chitinophagaceae bacterium]|nr:3-hydroxyacyl-ACP dehydratase [Chitinophagaceae bacterium]
MLLNDFFTINTIETSDAEVKAELVIHAGHRIFDGHFPGQPVVPGVCMMQMVKEVLEQVLEKETMLSTAAEMKFLAVIDPTKNNSISAHIKYTREEDGTVKGTASLLRMCWCILSLRGCF